MTTPRTDASGIPPGWTARDVADHEIAEAVLPLLELADALGPLVELISGRLMARFGHPDAPGVSDFDVANCWERVMGFAEYVQAMIDADRPGVMRGQCRLSHVHGSDHRLYVNPDMSVTATAALGSVNDAPGEPSTWVPAR